MTPEQVAAAQTIGVLLMMAQGVLMLLLIMVASATLMWAFITLWEKFVAKPLNDAMTVDRLRRKR